MKVTMLTTVAGGSAYGSLTSGTTYELPYDYAKSLVDAGSASYKYPPVSFVDPPDTVSPSAVAAAVRGLVANNATALFGDSISANNGGYGGTNPAATVYRTNDNGYFTWANALAGHPCNMVVNAGVSGDTTTGMLARIDADLLSYPIATAIILGGTNDIAGSVPVATIIRNLKAIYAKCAAKGIYVYALTIMPRPTVSAANQANLLTVNEWLRSYWNGSSVGECVDAFSALISPSSTAQAALSNTLDASSTHPTNLGAFLVGAVMAPRLASRFGGFVRRLATSAQDYYGTNSQSTNALRPLNLAGGGAATGTTTGTVALGSTVFANTTSCAASLAARSDGFGQDQVIAMTAGAGGQAMEMNFAGNPIGAPFAVGDTIQFEMSVTVDSGFTGLGKLFFYTSSSTWSNANAAFQAAGASNYALPGTNALTLTLVSPPVVIPPGAADLTPIIHAEFVAAGAATLRIGRIGYRKALSY